MRKLEGAASEQTEHRMHSLSTKKETRLPVMTDSPRTLSCQMFLGSAMDAPAAPGDGRGMG